MNSSLRRFFYKSAAAVIFLLSSKFAHAQFSNVFEIHSLDVSEVNVYLSELLSEKKSQLAIEVAAKAFTNLNKISQNSVIPALNYLTVFEIPFEDAIVLKTKSSLNSGDIFNFTVLPTNTKQQIIYALEHKYSSYFFNMFSLVHRLKLNYLLALNQAVESKLGSTAEIIALENDILGMATSSIANQFVLKNAKSGVVYAFDFLDLLNSSMPKASFASELTAMNAKMSEIYISTIKNSVNPAWASLKTSRRNGVIAEQLQKDIQRKNAEILAFVMGMEGNKAYVK